MAMLCAALAPLRFENVHLSPTYPPALRGSRYESESDRDRTCSLLQLDFANYGFLEAYDNVIFDGHHSSYYGGAVSQTFYPVPETLHPKP